MRILEIISENQSRVLIEPHDIKSMTQQLHEMGINTERVCPRQLKIMVDYISSPALQQKPEILQDLLARLGEIDRDLHDHSHLGIDSYRHCNTFIARIPHE